MRILFSKNLVVPSLLILGGFVFTAIGGFLTYQQRSMEQQGIAVPGQVIDLQENYDSDGSTYTPVVQFKTKSGQTVEFTSTYSSNPPAYQVGQNVTVVYLPDQPEQAVIQGEGQLLRIIFMISGGVTALVGASLFWTTMVRQINLQDQE